MVKSYSRLKLLECWYLLLIILAFPLLNDMAGTWLNLSKCLLNWIAQSACPTAEKHWSLTQYNWIELRYGWELNIQSRAGKYSVYKWLPEPKKASMINVRCLRTFLSVVLQAINWWELAIKMKHFSCWRYIPTPLLKREN